MIRNHQDCQNPQALIAKAEVLYSTCNFEHALKLFTRWFMDSLNQYHEEVSEIFHISFRVTNLYKGISVQPQHERFSQGDYQVQKGDLFTFAILVLT